MKKILIFEANSNQALSLSKYIKKYSSFYIVGAIKKECRFFRESYDEVFIQNFLEIDVNKYDYIFPMGADSTFQVISKYKTLHYKNNITFIDKNLIVFNKPKMLDIATTLNLPIPKTYYDRATIDKFPIFYKENFENGGGIRGVAFDNNTLPLKDGLIYQEYIDTPSTYGVAFIARDGNLLTYTVYKEVISYPIEGGSSVVIEVFMDDRLVEYTEKLLQKIGYNGWGLAEYKYCDKKDDFLFMEINGKFWASIEFMLQNNPQFLKLLLNVEYQVYAIKRFIFINRLLHYDILSFIQNIKYIRGAKIIRESSLIYQIIRKFVPSKIVKIFKRRKF